MSAYDDPSLFFNRELSWLDFNQRVLEIAERDDLPLLERVKFCAIYSSNLDEFFMVRVAGLWDQVDAGIDARGPDGLSPREQIEAIRGRTIELDRRLNRCFTGEILPRLADAGIRIASIDELGPDLREQVDRQFEQQVFPALTPLVIGLGRPIPYISNLSLSLAVVLRDPETSTDVFARIKVPTELLGRFIKLEDGDGTVLVPLEEVIAAHPGVLEVAAVGVPDEHSGEAVKLFVVRKNQALSEEEVRSYCSENLTGYKKPKYIEFRDELPKTNVGKILRRVLRDETLKKNA